jgi:catechol 2,3-dioxygenase-like lactoylglutathione lyase family enzyme
MFKKFLAFTIILSACISLNAQKDSVSQFPRSSFIALFVSDLEGTRNWYEQKLGFKTIYSDSPEPDIKFAVLEWNGFMLEMIQHPKATKKSTLNNSLPGEKWVEGFFKAGFYTDDLEAWEKILKVRKVEFKNEMIYNPRFRMKLFIIRDPENNLIQFYNIQPG